MARFNAGDEIGALAVLDDLRAARDAARKKRADIESAAEARRIATLALDARTKGKVTTAQAIARYEEVTRLDPGVSEDWARLVRLYESAGKLPDALRAARAAADSATNDRDRAVAFDVVSDVQRAQGDLPAALASNRASLAIVERLARTEPGNDEWRRGMAVSLSKIGDIQVAQGDQAAARTSYQESHAIFERLAEADPDNSERLRDLSISHNAVGDFLQQQGDVPAALLSYRASLAIAARLVSADPDNALWQRGLSLSHINIGDMQKAQGDLQAALGELPGIARDPGATGEGRSR